MQNACLLYILKRRLNELVMEVLAQAKSPGSCVVEQTLTKCYNQDVRWLSAMLHITTECTLHACFLFSCNPWEV